MFYNAKEVQRRIILEKYKGEDVDPSLYSGEFGDDVEAAENDYYDNYKIYWPDYSEQPKWSRETVDKFDDEGKGPFGKGGAYAAARRIQKHMVEKYGENWKDVAEKEIRIYYTKYKKKIEEELAKESWDEAEFKEKYPKAYQANRYRYSGNDTLKWKLEQAEKIIKNARHYILTQGGLNAVNAVEQYVERNGWGRLKDEAEHEAHERYVYKMAAFYVWSPFLKKLYSVGIKPKYIADNTSFRSTTDEVRKVLPKSLLNVDFKVLSYTFGQWQSFFMIYGEALINGNAKKPALGDFIRMASALENPLFRLSKEQRDELGHYNGGSTFASEFKNELNEIMDEAIKKAEAKWRQTHPNGDNTPIGNPFTFNGVFSPAIRPYRT